MRGLVENKWAGFDNIKATVTCGGLDCEDGNDILVSYEDFESSGDADTWQGGLESYGFGTSYLGRLGQQNPQVSKVFTVPTTTSSLDLSFDWYNTDNFASGIDDKFFIGIQNIEHELELIGSPGSSEYSGISYSFLQDNENSQIFHVDVNIPQSLYENGELLVSFRVEAYDITRRIGIDNVGIIGMCSSPSTNPSSFPSMEPSLIPRAPSVEEATESVPPSVWSNSDPSTNPSTEFVGFDWDDIVPSNQPSSTPNTDGDIDCADGDGVIITFEDFESSEQTESWKGANCPMGSVHLSSVRLISKIPKFPRRLRSPLPHRL